MKPVTSEVTHMVAVPPNMHMQVSPRPPGSLCESHGTCWTRLGTSVHTSVPGSTKTRSSSPQGCGQYSAHQQDSLSLAHFIQKKNKTNTKNVVIWGFVFHTCIGITSDHKSARAAAAKLLTLSFLKWFNCEYYLDIY